jgi:CRP-like cAMP-binding protein
MALVNRAKRNASVIARSPVKVVVMTGQAFRQMRREVPAVCERITQEVEERGRSIAPA